jgi:hypothetical protein
MIYSARVLVLPLFAREIALPSLWPLTAGLFSIVYAAAHPSLEQSSYHTLIRALDTWLASTTAVWNVRDIWPQKPNRSSLTAAGCAAAGSSGTAPEDAASRCLTARPGGLLGLVTHSITQAGGQWAEDASPRPTLAAQT